MTRKEYPKKAREARGPAYTVEELRRMGKETHEDRECPRCWDGSVYDSEAGARVDHDGCSGTGRARVFVYPKVGWLRACDGCGERFPAREMVEVVEDHESLTFFLGDEVCRECAGAHGVV